MNKLDFGNSNLKNLFLIGISHWNTPLDVRGRLCLSKEEMRRLYQSAKKEGVNSIFALSTCNRTEIYAIAENANQLSELWCKTKFLNLPPTGSTQHASHELNKYISTKRADDAAQHLFHVAAGLDAQILGDAQITGQIREFHQLALENGMLDAVLNRLIELAISFGKKIKTRAQINNEATSIAHAGVLAAVKNYHRETFRALVIGSGKTGMLAVKSLLKVIPPANITLLNRTDAKAYQAAKEFTIHTDRFGSLKSQIAKSDVIFTATSSLDYLITNDFLRGFNLESKLFIDLCIPRNIAPDLNATLIDIGQLSNKGGGDISEYKAIAEKFVIEGMAEYDEWLHRYELAQAVKSSVSEFIFNNGLEESEAIAPSKFIDGITSRHLRYFQKGKQSRNLAA